MLDISSVRAFSHPTPEPLDRHLIYFSIFYHSHIQESEHFFFHTTLISWMLKFSCRFTKMTSQLMKVYALKWDLVLCNKIKVTEYTPKVDVSGQGDSAWKMHHRRTQCSCGKSTSSKGWVQSWDLLLHPVE